MSTRSKSRAWTSFLRNDGHWHMCGFGLWAIEPHSGAHMSGQAGFFYGMRGLGPDFDEWPEASWVLDPDLHGQGLGLEAARAMHDWFDRVVTGPLVCKLEPQNIASRRIAEYLGYKPMREATWAGRASLLMSRKSPPGGSRNLLA